MNKKNVMIAANALLKIDSLVRELENDLGKTEIAALLINDGCETIFLEIRDDEQANKLINKIIKKAFDFAKNIKF